MSQIVQRLLSCRNYQRCKWKALKSWNKYQMQVIGLCHGFRNFRAFIIISSIAFFSTYPRNLYMFSLDTPLKTYWRVKAWNKLFECNNKFSEKTLNGFIFQTSHKPMFSLRLLLFKKYLLLLNFQWDSRMSGAQLNHWQIFQQAMRFFFSLRLFIQTLSLPPFAESNSKEDKICFYSNSSAASSIEMSKLWKYHAFTSFSLRILESRFLLCRFRFSGTAPLTWLTS